MSGDSRATSPEPAAIRDARERAGLTQVEAAELVHATDRTWQNWESGAFKMAPGLWELFLLKVAQRDEAQP